MHARIVPLALFNVNVQNVDMWPFRTRKGQLDDIRRDVATLQDAHRALKAEWLDWESRLGRLYQRNVKAADRWEKSEAAKHAASEAETGDQSNGALPTDPRLMRKDQLRVLAQTLRGHR